MKKYDYSGDSSFENALHDCKLVDETIVDADTYQQADYGLIMYHMKKIMEALKKQVPMKPKLTTIFEGKQAEKLKEKGIENFSTYKCPICNSIVADRTFVSKFHSDGWKTQNYCDRCGQKLDWEN